MNRLINFERLRYNKTIYMNQVTKDFADEIKKKYLINAKKMGYTTFENYARIDILKKLFPNYSWQKRKGATGIHIKDDYLINFYRVKIRGVQIYFIKDDHQPKTIHIFFPVYNFQYEPL